MRRARTRAAATTSSETSSPIVAKTREVPSQHLCQGQNKHVQIAKTSRRQARGFQLHETASGNKHKL